MRLLSIFMLIIFAFPSWAQTKIPGEIPVTELVDNTVYIDVVDENGKSRGDPGSGVLLGPNGFILTARHIIEPNRKDKSDKIVVALKTPHGQRLPARLFGCTIENFDACLLYVQSIDIAAAGITKSFPLSCRMPAATERIVISGYPIQPSSFVVVSGSVTSSDLGELDKMYTDAGILPGMSGGPVLDQFGAIIGIVWGHAQNAPLGLFTPLTQASSLLPLSGIPCLTSVPGPILAQPSSAEVQLGKPNEDHHIEPYSLPPSPSATSDQAHRPSKVFIQISSTFQRSFADEALRKLKAAGISVAEGVENVGAKAPLSAQIRYFREEDRTAAEETLDAIGGKSSSFNLIKVNVQNPPPGLIELWYPRCDKSGLFCQAAPVGIESEVVTVSSGGTKDNKSDICKAHTTDLCLHPAPHNKLVVNTVHFVAKERSAGIYIDGNTTITDPIGTSNIGWFVKPDRNTPNEICATVYARASACETEVRLSGRLQGQQIHE